MSCGHFLSLDISLRQIDNLDSRGVQLAALFMSGVDMALFANDACGQPIPWEHCCPWMYFDGKLLQSKFIRANREKAQLIDLCDGQVASSTTPTSLKSALSMLQTNHVVQQHQKAKVLILFSDWLHMKPAIKLPFLKDM